MTNEPLTLKFDPQTVDHLGSRMYSHLPNAIAELVANAYDADAHHVIVKVDENQSISVIDDGHGMSRSDIADKYLHIGRNRRKDENSSLTESGKRRVSGKKGLGKLALFGIGNEVTLRTTRADLPIETRVCLSYDDLMATHGEYKPRESSYPCGCDEHGTTVTLTKLKRKTKINCPALAKSLSRLFNYADSDFKVTIESSTGEPYRVGPEIRLGSIAQEFSWTFPDDLDDSDSFLSEHKISGQIISAEKPLNSDLRGITLYADGRLVNEPEFFGSSESSYAYSYLTGYLNVDFINDLNEDVIATDRRAVVWDNEYTEELRRALATLLTRIGRNWREFRSAKRKEKREHTVGVSAEKWLASIRATEDRESLNKVIDYITSDDLDLTVQQEGHLLKDIRRLAPPHAEYVWRRLHSEIRDAAQDFYEKGDYFHAIDEAMKRYVRLVAEKMGIPRDRAHEVLAKSFGLPKDKKDSRKKQGKWLSVSAKYRKTGRFSDQIMNDIDQGQQQLSLGLLTAFRNTVDHEEIDALQSTGALTYEDCLDALSMLSYLMRRLSDAEIIGDTQ